MKIKLLSTGYDDGIHRSMQQVFKVHYDMRGPHIRPLGDDGFKSDEGPNFILQPCLYFTEAEAQPVADSKEIWHLPNRPILHLRDSILTLVEVR